jgi:Family of unknown function (DUF6603)
MTTGNRAGTLETLGVQVATLFAAIGRRLAEGGILPMLAELGYQFPGKLAQDAGLRAAVDTCVAAGGKLGDAARRVVQASDTDNLTALAGASIDLVSAVSALLDAVDALSTALSRAAAALPNLPPAELAEFVSALPRRMIELAIVTTLEERIDVLAGFLDLFGIIERTEENVGSTDPLRPPFTRVRLRLDRLPKLFTSPGELGADLYGWGTSSFNGEALFGRIASVLSRSGFPAYYDGSATPPVLELVVAQAEVAPIAPEPGVRLRLRTSVDETFEQSDETGLHWSATVRVRAPEGSELIVAPDGGVRLAAPGGSSTEGELRLNVEFEPGDPPDPVVLFGQQAGTRLQIRKARFAAGTRLSWDGTAGASVGTAEFVATIDRGELVVKAPQGDGFLGRVLPSGDDSAAEFALEIGLARSGFYVRGSATLELAIPVHREFGPVTVDQVLVSLRPDGGRLTGIAAVALRAQLGPVQVVVDRVGLRLEASFPESRGNLGPLQLDIGFEPPSGAGLAIDAAGVTGGGFLEHRNHEYAGVLQLQYIDLALQAFGLITTQVAGGAGYSLLALVDAEFPPVQLGWGFTLDGVGGLLAVHRTASTDALHAALKAGQLSSVLFPKSAIENAPAILGQLDALFPTAPGRFLFGPMALIGWGTPNVLKAAIAVIVELPEPIRVILLARIEARLPDESQPRVRINMDALGVLDLGKDELSFDAVLFDSKLVSYTLSGAMALRATWATKREFVLAIGGVHPRFTPPPGFPALQRITIDMPSGSISKLRLAAYLALTSNSIQIGANLDVHVEVSGFGVTGHLGFDALLQRDPFRFDADISGTVAIVAGGDDLASVELDATLSGPAPYHIAGKFKVHVVFFDVHVSFDHSWGEEAAVLPRPSIDVGDLLRKELAKPDNWDVMLPAGVSPLVSVRRIDNPGGVPAHPLARPQVHERIVPLGLTITRLGEAIPSGDTQFAIRAVRVGSGANTSEPIQDDFAPAQFFDLTEEEKLERPSFERHDAGVRVSGTVATAAPVAKTTAYETYYVDTPGGPPLLDTGAAPPRFALGDLVAVLQFGAMGRAAKRTSARRYQTPGNPIRVTEPAFVLVDKTTLAASTLGAAAGTTFSALAPLLARNPTLQIVATHEMTVN